MNKIEYILASSKPWSSQLDSYLEDNLQKKFFWVHSKDELSLALENIKPKYIFFLHWNWIVPPAIFNSYECICFHMTDVPYGRGGSPLQNLIIRGHKTTKLTALRMIENMDAGPVYMKKELDLSGSAQDIYIRATKLSFELVELIVKHRPEPKQQYGDIVSFTRRTPEQSEIPENVNDAIQLYDFIRMLDAPTYPNAFIRCGNLILKLNNAQLFEGKVRAIVEIDIENKKRG